MKYEISKPKVEHYKLRLPETSMYWANIFLEDVGHGGRITITSDYGIWSNFWDGIGSKTFKEFLIYLTSLNDLDYVSSKFDARANGRPTTKFQRFWVEVWPDFIEILKSEIDKI